MVSEVVVLSVSRFVRVNACIMLCTKTNLCGAKICTDSSSTVIAVLWSEWVCDSEPRRKLGASNRGTLCPNEKTVNVLLAKIRICTCAILQGPLQTIVSFFRFAVIEMKSEDRGKFFDALSALLIPK